MEYKITMPIYNVLRDSTLQYTVADMSSWPTFQITSVISGHIFIG